MLNDLPTLLVYNVSLASGTAVTSQEQAPGALRHITSDLTEGRAFRAYLETIMPDIDLTFDLTFNDGAVIEDALVLVNSDTIPYDFGVYQLSLPTSNSYDLTITHDGNLIASGEGVKTPDAIPVISNLDSGDVHQKNTDLIVQWGSVSDVTSWQVTNTVNGSQTYQSALLPLDARSHVIPGPNFSPGQYDVQVSAINGLYPGDDPALSNPDSGYDIEGPKGYFIGITQSDYVEIIVND